MNKSRNIILNESVGKLIIKFSLPTITVLLINALYNMIDAIFVGNQPNGTLGIAGLTIVLPIQLLILALAQTIGMGSASILSRAIGARDNDKANRIAGNSFSSVIVLGILVTALGLFFIKPILLLFGSTDSIYPYAYKYLRIILFGSIFNAFALSTNCIVRGEGKVITSMIAMVLGSLINIPLDYIFVVKLKMGVEGAAIATVISQIVCFVFLLGYFLLGKSNLKVKAKDLSFDLSLIKEILVTGSPTIISHATNALLSIVLVNSLKYYGQDIHITILGIFNRTFPFVYFPMLGIMQALQPIVGLNYGAKQMNRVRKAVKLSLILVSIIGVVGFGVFALFTNNIFSIFCNDSKLITMAIRPYRIVTIMIPVLGFQVIGCGFFQAIGKVIPSLILSISRQALFMIPLMLLLPFFFGINGVWYSVPLSDLLSALVTSIFLARELQVLNRSLNKKQVLEN